MMTLLSTSQYCSRSQLFSLRDIVSNVEKLMGHRKKEKAVTLIYRGAEGANQKICIENTTFWLTFGTCERYMSVILGQYFSTK